jgi:O-acetyl-ADP-ribose deacetylase (regulator of RNase III)
MGLDGLVKSFLDGRVVVLVGDITKQDVEAIVNAANSSLMGGGGVDGAIHRAGGPQIVEECRKIRRTRYPDGLPTGQAVMTTGGNLIARYVIHTVGPVYGQESGREADLLASCYDSSLALAANYSLNSLAFPAISTGIYGYPRADAAAIASATINRFVSNNSQVKEIRMLFFQDSDAQVFLENQKFEK